MKLNKPEVNAEQTLLEEYVDFLLTDHSNVHSLTQHLNSDSQELNDEPSVDFSEPSASSIAKASTLETQNNKTESKPQKPNWTTIENAVAKKGKTDEKTDSSQTTTDLPESEHLAETISKVKTESHAQINEYSERKSSDSFRKKITQNVYVEEPELEQAKAWDALISAEKENSESEPLIEKKTIPKEVKLSIEEEELLEKDPRLDNVKKLLAKISLATMPSVEVDTKALLDTGLTEESLKDVVDAKSVSSEQTINKETTDATFLHREPKRTRDILPDVFQTLLFHVGKLPLAVPLLKLGGIVKISREEITPLVGSPDWFLGLLPNDRSNLMVVDTQRYLMPEQAIDGVEQDYQYLIVLDNSNWALACNTVADAKNLKHSDIRWSEKNSQRPWFAGMVVDYMSALLEVDELINMLADQIVE